MLISFLGGFSYKIPRYARVYLFMGAALDMKVRRGISGSGILDLHNGCKCTDQLEIATTVVTAMTILRGCDILGFRVFLLFALSKTGILACNQKSISGNNCNILDD